MKRSAVVGFAAGALATLMVFGLVGSAVAVPPSQQCTSTGTMNTTKLAAIVRCLADLEAERDAAQDAEIAEIRRQLTWPSPSPSASASATPSQSASPTVTPEPTVTPSETTPTASATPSATPTPTSTPSSTPTGATGALNLPTKAYAGGPEFWAKYPAAKSAGWDDPNFFPIVVWYGSCSSEQTAFDKARGINTYAQCNPDTTAAQLPDMSTLFTPKTPGTPRQTGVLLDDEVDGRYTDAAGQKLLTDLAAQHRTNGRFAYVNYTSGIVTFDRSMSNSSAYLNGAFNDVIGLDQYFYSNPQCSWTNDGQAFRYRTPVGQTPINRANCRTASSYGKAQDLLREVDASDGKVDKAIFAFVEVVAPGGGTQNGGSYVQPTGAQIKGAAWQSIIHGAAGIDWFSNSPDGGSANPCLSGDVLADARLGRGCTAVAPNVQAMGEVNAQIKSLAPVLNTDTLVWDFEAAADTMLKAKDGSAYVFAMTKDGGTGSRTFTLPDGVTGDSVEVVGENRNLSVTAGKFTDTFSKESDTHIYRIKI